MIYIHTHVISRYVAQVELVVAKRIEERSLCLSSSGKCHGDIGTPVRVSFEFLEVFFFVEQGGDIVIVGKLK